MNVPLALALGGLGAGVALRQEDTGAQLGWVTALPPPAFHLDQEQHPHFP